MPVIDLTRYIVASAGTWTDPSQDPNLFQFTLADTRSPARLMLRWAGDFVALSGPLAVRVTVQAENLTLPLGLVGNLIPDATGTYVSNAALSDKVATLKPGVTLSESALGRFANTGGGLGLQASTIYSYRLEIAAGQAWPFNLSEQLDALRLRGLAAARYDQLGNNLGFRVVIEPAFTPDRCEPTVPTNDLPCDYAVADRPQTARFFPSACEPCEGSVIGLPPSGSVTLVTPPAEGGCVRTRFFNGMFISREDLETEQRYLRLKFRLHNRASGAGVVWGLGVGLQGGQVCVLPGYGVDCCGNDLALTSTYRVDGAALIADPAAASLVYQRGPQRLHLLLEYVECPSDPRPVHGDPCAPEASRCEMSRIRESVRLRLVPPRDCDSGTDKGPIGRFLAEVRELRRRYPLGTHPTSIGADRAPFRLRITATSGMVSTVEVRPSSQFDPAPLRPLIGGTWGTIQIDLEPDPLWTLAVGTVSGQALLGGQTVAGAVAPADPVTLSLASGFSAGAPSVTFTLRGQTGRADQLVYRVSGWQAQHLLAAEDDPAPSGDLTLTFRLSGVQMKGIELVETPIVSRPLDLAAAPCAGEPCAPRTAYDRASVFQRGASADRSQAGLTGLCQHPNDPYPVLPWLHPDPTHPAAAGDPKALVLAALGGWIAQMLVREQAGLAGEVTSPRREIAQGIYRIAWVLLFGVSQDARPEELGGTLKRLLEAWCDGLLWKGPECCGDPHGVVIGCAVVAGGVIQEIDPFGGRRYVVHYPLLAHWGTQFGIAPPDLTLSRLFSTLCCVASLPAVAPREPVVPAGLATLGNGYLAVGDPKDIAAQVEQQKLQIVSERPAGLAEMIASALTLIGTQRSTANRQYTALVLSDLVAEGTVMLLLPA